MRGQRPHLKQPRDGWAPALARMTCCLLLGGCDVVLQDGLGAAEAAARCAQLHASGIRCTADHAGRVRVDGAQVADAVRELIARRPQQPDFEAVYGEAPLVPTPAEERARAIHALAGEIAASLRAREDVEEARVHLPPDTLARDVGRTHPRAAVWVRARPGRIPSTAAIAALVAAAAPPLQPSDVRVEVERTPATKPGGEPLSRVGPFRVASASVPSIRAFGAASLSLNALLAVAVAVLWRRRHQRP